MPIRCADSIAPFARERNIAIRILRAATVCLSLLLLLTGCGANGEPVATTGSVQEFATPPFYRIEGHGGGTLLLMGTVHVGPPEGWHFSPAILEGIEQANRFVLELDPRTATGDTIGSLLAETVAIRPPSTLMTLVSPETAKLLDENDAVLAQMGMPRLARKWKKPWYIALTLLEWATTRSGFSSSASAESVVLEALESRPLIGLETIEEQLGLFDKLSPQLQDIMLRDALLRLDTTVEEIHALVDAWRRGDEDQLDELTREGIDELPGLEDFYRIVLIDRNQRWMTHFKSLLDDTTYSGETVFVAVGALHLVGDDGLVSLLRTSGYEARAIDHSTGKK
jgi:hypothetical protein